ncbi:hypothetical protein [Streptomyces sp. NPDC093225]|uniref:hypothetical protein n=1 Tax=Streptomyces sp. NPDC093225 TaxID=3366034 RepID=UPI00380135BF
MNQTRMRASALAATAVSFCGILATAQPAAAAETCTTKDNSRIIAMSGAIPETWVGIPTCVEALPGDKVRGTFRFHWKVGPNDGQSDFTSKRFTSFKVTVRLESRFPGGADTVVTSKTCDFAEDINKALESNPNAEVGCVTPAAALDHGKQWSGDATAVYDVAGDNKGPITWNLNGSPLMS